MLSMYVCVYVGNFVCMYVCNYVSVYVILYVCMWGWAGRDRT